MALMDSAGRFSSLRLSGLKASADVRESLTSVSVSLSATQISEIQFSFLDSETSAVSRGSWLTSGSATATYNGWKFTVGGVDSDAGDAGPEVSVVASSRAIRALKAQTGGKNWGTVDRRAWAASMAKSVGFKLLAPDLGRGKMSREKKEKGSDAQSTWDLLVDLAAERRAMIFEFGTTLVIGSPAWLVSKSYGGRDWNVRYSSSKSMSDQLVDAPVWSYDEDSDEGYSVTVKLLAPDAHLVRPGDTLRISGNRLPYNGAWLVTQVDLDVARDSPVVVKAIKPYALPKQEKQEPATGSKSSRASSSKAASKATGAKGSTRATYTKANKTMASKILTWGRPYVGRSIDYDGGYGAQCVDGFKMYIAAFVSGPALRGNGKDNVKNAVRSGAYTYVSPSGRAQAGDVVSWDGSWGRGYGHVGVVIEDRGQKLYVWHQFNGSIKIGELTKRGCVGYARPKRFKK